jgi:peptide/nickel transport system substrate-binding protein
MKRFGIILAVLIILTFLISSCSGSTTTSTTTTSTTTTQVNVSTTKTTSAPSSTSTAPGTTTSTTTKPSTTTTSNIQKGGKLRIIYPFSPVTNVGWPNDTTNPQRLWANWVMWEPLVDPKLDGTVTPRLATEWVWGPNNSNITFTLRQGVKFHDGTTFNADAVKFEGDLLITEKAAAASKWQSWDIIDDYHVRLNLKQYTNDFWSTLVGTNMMFTSPTAARAHDKAWMVEHPIGTGPFKFLSFEKDVSLKFVKNPDYWDPGKPYLDEIDFITVKETMTQQASMQSGAGDILALQEGKVLFDLKKQGFSVISAFGGTGALLFDSANASSKFADKRVRQAVEYAIDKKALVTALGYGYQVEASQMPPPNNPAYNKNIVGRNIDTTKAKQLLAEAGYPTGFKTTLFTGTVNQARALAEQEYLKAVGINVTIEALDNAKMWEMSFSGFKEGIGDTDLSTGINFPSFLRNNFPPTSPMHVSVKFPDEIVAKIDPALAEADPVKAKQLSDELIQMVWEDASIVPLYSNAMGYVLTPQVHDTGIFEGPDFMFWRPADTWISK